MRRFACLYALVLTLIPTAVFAQTGDTGAASIASLVVAVVTPIIAYLSTLGYDGIKTIIPPFDDLRPIVHQVLAPLFGFGFGWLTTHLGVGLLTDIHQIGPEWVGAILNALFMAGLKRWQKSREPGDATIKLARSRLGQV